MYTEMRLRMHPMYTALFVCGYFYTKTLSARLQEVAQFDSLENVCPF